MVPRPLILTGMLGAAVAGPMVMSNDSESLKSLWSDGQSQPQQLATEQARAVTPAPVMTPPPVGELQHNGSRVYLSPAPLEGHRVSISEALRMDVSRQWVYARWARKSTGLADTELFGVRVPLVTGRQMTDIAGAMSYYFDAQGVVQRIRFHGRTADTSQLISIVTQRFGLSRQSAAPGEQLYQRLVRGGVESELRTRPESVLWGSAPHSSFVVDLEINRPGSGLVVKQPEPRLSLPEPVAATPSAGASQVDPAAESAEAEEQENGPLFGLAPGNLPPNRWPQ